MQDTLRHIMSADSKPSGPRKKGRHTGSRTAQHAESTIAQGQLLYEYTKMCIGEEAMSHIVKSGESLRVPRHFWSACCHHCFNLVVAEALRKRLSKALTVYLAGLRKGATTTCGMLGEKHSKQRRSKGGSQNAVKCPELGQLLYDWFIDCLQSYSRVNYSLLIGAARDLKQRLLLQGYEPQLMPSLDGEAGYSWLRRWRKKFNISSRKVKHLKVSRAKLKQRVRVYLKNVSALRFYGSFVSPTRK